MGNKTTRDTRKTPVDTSGGREDSARKHLGEMRDGRFPIYALFDAIDHADLPDDDKRALRKEIAPLVEFSLTHRAKVGSEVSATAQALIELGPADSRDAFTAWRKTGENCVSVPGLKLVLLHFGQWLKQAKPSQRARVGEILPRLAPLVAELGEKEVGNLVRSATAPSASEAADLLLSMLDDYAHTTGPILGTLMRIGRHACSVNALPILKRLTAAMPAPKLINHREGRRMIRGLGNLHEFAAKRDDAVWRAAFDLAGELASQNYASLHIAARDLPGIVRRMPEDTVVGYLRDVKQIVHTMGAGASWFGLSKLPGIYAKQGPKRANGFVSAAAELAESYGAKAAWWYLEQKTDAARQALD